MASGSLIGVIFAFLAVSVLTLLFFMSRYKYCPSDHILIVYGTGLGTEDGGPKVIHGGADSSGP